jgi:dTDP-4-amino-4,6-dideoxygalactose transaminase
MYRNNDLTAAFGRAQLTRVDMYLDWQRKSAELLHQTLEGAPFVILPTEPPQHDHSWYNYVLRFDLAAIGQEENASEFRDKIVNALRAEGVPIVVWQRFILPRMTVFQAKNAYGYGAPWSSPHAQRVDYSLEQYPVAQRHSDMHACLVQALRYPNPPELVERIGEAVWKVMRQVDALVELSPA